MLTTNLKISSKVKISSKKKSFIEDNINLIPIFFFYNCKNYAKLAKIKRIFLTLKTDEKSIFLKILIKNQVSLTLCISVRLTPSCTSLKCRMRLPLAVKF